MPTVAGLFGGDTATGLAEVYADSNTGSNKTLSVSAYSVNDGNGGNNYTASTVSNAAGVILITTAAVIGASVGGLPVSSITYGTLLTLSATVSATIGTAVPTAGSVDFRDGNTELGATATASVFANNAVFTLVTTPSQLQVLLANGGVHTVTAAYAPGNGFNGSTGTLAGGLSVTPAPLTITATASTKVYDSTTNAASLPTASGLVGSDTVTGLAEVYGDRNTGSSKTLSVSAYTIADGNGGTDYTVTTVASTAGVITAAPLTITAVANTKMYDGTLTAAVLPSVAGLQGSDTVTGSAEAYADGNTGSDKTLSVIAYTVNDGNSGNNYAVSTVSKATGVITLETIVSSYVSSLPVSTTVYGTPVTLSATVFPATGTSVPSVGTVDFRDGTTDLGMTSTGSVSGSNAIFTLVTTISQLQVLLANGGVHTVTAVYSPADGSDASTAILVGGLKVTPASLTITAITYTKTYDATASAAAAPTVSGLIGGDTVTGLAEAYSNRNAGSNKSLSVYAYTVNDSNGGSDYLVTTISNTTGVITPASLTITAVTNTKAFDGTTSAIATPVVAGLQGNDTVTAQTEVFLDSSTGSNKTLSVNSYTVNDANGGNNYSVATVGNATGYIGIGTSISFRASVNGSPVSAITYGKAVTLVATISATSGTGPPTAGSVDFQDGGTDLGVIASETVSGSNGVFTLITTPTQLPVILGSGGVHTITAIYAPGSGFVGSTVTLAGGLKVNPCAFDDHSHHQHEDVRCDNERGRPTDRNWPCWHRHNCEFARGLCQSERQPCHHVRQHTHRTNHANCVGI